MNPIPFENIIFSGNRAASPAVKLKVNPITLSFCDDQTGLEKLFLSDYFASNLKHLRLCHFIAIFFYGLTAVTEFFLFPASVTTLLMVRFGIVIPFFIIGFIISFSEGYAKYWQLIDGSYVLATGGGFIAMIVLGPKPGIYS